MSHMNSAVFFNPRVAMVESRGSVEEFRRGNPIGDPEVPRSDLRKYPWQSHLQSSNVPNVGERIYLHISCKIAPSGPIPKIA
jgi:hypothetical protein